MPHLFEPAKSGRAKCRGCGRAIAKDTVRFGEAYPNPFGDGEATLWFHPLCAALKRPEPLSEILDQAPPDLPDGDRLEPVAAFGLAHRRLPRLDGAELAPTGRARCRSCKEMIAKGTWRIRLVFYEDGRFDPSGTIHAACAREYFETADVLDRIRHFTELTDEQAAEIATALQGA